MPAPGEKTGIQSIADVGFSLTGGGLGVAPDRGTFDTYRKMRANPTLALVNVIETAPIRSTTWSIDGVGDTDENVVEFVRAVIDPMMQSIVRECVRSLDFGFTPFEKVWEIRRVNGRLALAYRKMKPLLVDISEPLIDKEDGGFRGIKNGDVQLPAENAFWFAFSGEPGHEWYGRSKFENLRECGVWNRWRRTLDRMDKYASRAAGAKPLIQYPEGEGKDKHGNTKTTFEIAQTLLKMIDQGHGVTMPNTLAKFATELANRGVPIDKLRAWVIDFMEPNGQYGNDFTNMLMYYDKLLARGRLVPERAAFEGEHGTKADSETHSDVVIESAEMFNADLAQCINDFAIDPLLLYNFGEEAVGSVKIQAEPLIDEKRQIIKEMTLAAMTSPTNVVRASQILDLEGALEKLGVPTRDVADLPPDPIEPDPLDEDEPLTTAALSMIAKRASRRRKTA
ncbi:MAG: hypothetical protein AAF432_00385 [Planctomycetota bacterium]